MKDETQLPEEETKPRGLMETLAPPILAPIAATLLVHIPAYLRHPEDTILYGSIIFIVMGTIGTLIGAAITILTGERKFAAGTAAAAAFITIGVATLCRDVFL